ncbi:MAG TPA: citryl-CoA lyase [Noviherbaspirillum sp.]|nr:citryl-CoA lyase [Noviherbaspirillum sp.]
MSDDFSQVIHSHIWKEEPETDNPFAASKCLCHGYDVYGDVMGKASYVQYLYLLFKGDRPSKEAAAALEMIAIALANPGPRDPSVHAAMAAGVGGSPAATALMSALAASAGSHGGAREVLLAMDLWRECGMNLVAWKERLALPEPPSRPLFWPQIDHAPGFDPHGASCATPVRQTLSALAGVLGDGRVMWLEKSRTELEASAGHPLAMAGVVAAAFADLGFSPQEAEMLTLLMRLPGAAAHALEQWQRGFRQFPFFSLELENDPGPVAQKEQA